jgi:hypothetical protein
MTEPTIIHGQRIVRLVQASVPVDLMNMQLWYVRDLHGRMNLGPSHFTRTLAAAWATAQGWRHIGTQERADKGY